MANTMNEQQQECRREGTQRLIDNMLIERQQMLTLMCKVSGMEPFTHDKPIQEELQEFCQILVDYIATSHFGLYERIAGGKERRQRVLDIAREIYHIIDDSTQSSVSFNDKYETAKMDEPVNESLQQDLSALSEKLANRIEYEDKLINVMRA